MIRQILLISSIISLFAIPSISQENPFSTAVTVNEIGISYYEIDQRKRLLTALNSTEDIEQQAEENLIAERLYMDEARRLGLGVSANEIEEGIAEFSARASLEPKEFLDEIAVFGVTQESFAAFIRAGVAWRKVISGRYNQLVDNLNIQDVEQNLAFEAPPTFTSFLISEIALSLRPSAAERSREIANQIYETISTIEEFRDTATSLSISETGSQGGAIGWIQLEQLPGNLRPSIMKAAIGTVTAPVESEGAIYVFFKEDQRLESGSLLPETNDYAVLRIEPLQGVSASARASEIQSSLRTCNDLRSVALEFPEGSLRIGSATEDEGGGTYANELAVLDSRETRILTIDGSNDVNLLMLCSRRASLPEEQQEAVLNVKRNEKLEKYAQLLLQNLRSNAYISRD